MIGALSHQDFPFSLLVEELRPLRDASRSPIFEVMFNLLSRQTLGSLADLLVGDEASEPVDFGGMRLNAFPLVQQTGAFDFALELVDMGTDVTGFLMFSTDLFKRETIVRMAGHFRTLLDTAARNPDLPVSTLPMLSKEELRWVVHDCNATDSEYPREKCVHDLVRDQALQSPGAIAVICDGQQMTYAELIEEAEQVAQCLRSFKIGAGSLVGICMDRCLDLPVSILAVLQTGAAYVPMDPAFPTERLSQMMEDAGCAVIITHKSLAGLPAWTDTKMLFVDELPAGQLDTRIAAPSVETPADPESLAYMIYTSGSTGRPKGVEITHRALVNFLCSTKNRPGITAPDILLSVTTVSFDIFALELFLPLIAGACTFVASRQTVSDGLALARILAASRATIMQATPATWRLLLESGWKNGSGLKALCGGEALSRELADRIMDTGAELWNMYGPTETTVWSAVERVRKGKGPISIGEPINNTQLLVLDAELNPLPFGVPGELFIGGHGLARGYHNMPEVTQRSFVANPFSEGHKLYRTGDLVRRLPGGCIEYLGRVDHQVKLRGYRIELGEIEFHLDGNPGIQKSIVVLKEEDPDNPHLIAYFMTKGRTKVNIGELRRRLQERLPA